VKKVAEMVGYDMKHVCENRMGYFKGTIDAAWFIFSGTFIYRLYGVDFL